MMTAPYIGIALTIPPLGAAPAYVDPYVTAFTAPCWHKPLRYYSGIVQPKKPPPRRPGMLRKGDLASELRGLLCHDSLYYVSLATSARNDDQFACLDVETRPSPQHEHVVVHGRHWLDATTVSTMDAWVDEMLALASQTGAKQGVIPVMHEAGVASDVSLVGIAQLGRVLHPFPEQFERMERNARSLGTRYARFPRWGTLYAHEWVAALGGEARIREVVRPAVVRDLGKAVYFQLTERVSTAMTAEALEKQRAFEALAAPLLPPARSR